MFNNKFADVFKGLYQDKLYKIKVHTIGERRPIVLTFTNKLELLQNQHDCHILANTNVESDTENKFVLTDRLVTNIMDTDYSDRPLFIQTNNVTGIKDKNDNLVPYLWYDTRNCKLFLEQILHYFNYPNQLYFTKEYVSKYRS